MFVKSLMKVGSISGVQLWTSSGKTCRSSGVGVVPVRPFSSTERNNNHPEGGESDQSLDGEEFDKGLEFEGLEVDNFDNDEGIEEREKMMSKISARLSRDRTVNVPDTLNGTVPTHVEANIAALKDILASVARREPNESSTLTEETMSKSEEQAEATKRKLLRKMGPEYMAEGGIQGFACQYGKELELLNWEAEEKLVKFPIDNEAVVWEESTVDFTEHIFLHKYIALFPKETHRFMETIISALQNNPDYTVAKKKEIIWSYYNYFNYHDDKLEEDDEEVIEV